MHGTLQPVANPDFKMAARRHHDDARFLLGDGRSPNADHLAGLAAECALKAIMQLAPFNLAPNAKGILVGGQPAKKLQKHGTDLWKELAQIISGHSAPVFAALLVTQDPFANWDVSDRYSDGTAITQQDATAHLGTAGQFLVVLQQAALDGYVS